MARKRRKYDELDYVITCTENYAVRYIYLESDDVEYEFSVDL